MKKSIFLTMILILLLAACSSRTESVSSDQTVEQADPTQMDLPFSTTLAIGTLKLEETKYAIASDQAADLLPLWQVLRSLTNSDTAALEEIEAIIDQIQETMTPQQMDAIQAMNLTREDIFASMQELGLVNAPQVNTQGTPQAGEGFRGDQGPGGSFPPGGGPGGGRPGGDGQELSPEQIATAQARRAENGTRMNTRLLSTLIDPVIELLEEKVQ
jgi:hypothetical protein